MPRERSTPRMGLLGNAMKTFWKFGFHVVSMGDLVRETGVSRGGIYSDYSSKRALFHACIDHYEDVVIKPVFAPVEEAAAGVEGIRTYLEALLTRFDTNQNFGRGCLVGNTFTQLAEGDDETRQKILRFYARRTCSYSNALSYENSSNNRLTEADVEGLASYVTISVQGLWSYSRLVQDSSVLRQYCDMLLAYLESHLRGTPRSNYRTV
ncbi:MAG: TetR family transcriptional regulator [Gammaproteobacteria bacterium]|nr:TetR family transcriptional regulator [Gammaproteobacteria bacterium]